jgi:outer membrane protein
MALKNNPRVTASHLLALAAGQVTRETRSTGLPQINSNVTAVKAEDGSRIGSGELNSSRLYTHAGAGGTLSQLLTDFGHTKDLVANSRLQAKAQQQNALATEQDVLIATDQAFYRLLDVQSLLGVAIATVKARADVQSLTQTLTKSALKSDLDLNISSADLSQAQLLHLDAENSVASARAALAELLAAPPETQYRAVDDGTTTPPLPPGNSSALIKEAQAQRPDLQALRLDTQADQKFARAQELQHLPSISALAMGGVTPVGPDGGIFTPNWYAAAGVNLTLPVFTGFRINAQTQETRLRERASEKQTQELSDAIARDVRIATLSAQTAFRRIGVAEAFQNQTAQALSLAQTRYKLGLSSIVELSQAQLQSTQAAVEAVNARFDYLFALRSLDYAAGELAP